MDYCMRWVFSLFLKSCGSLYRSRMSVGSRFHSCGDEMEKPRRPERSLRKRGTKSCTCVADRRLRLAGISLIKWQSSVKYAGAWPTRQFLVMIFSLNCIRAWIGSQWRSRRTAVEIGTYFPIFRIRRAEEFRTDWRRSRRYALVPWRRLLEKSIREQMNACTKVWMADGDSECRIIRINVVTARSFSKVTTLSKKSNCASNLRRKSKPTITEKREFNASETWIENPSTYQKLWLSNLRHVSRQDVYRRL